MKRAIKLRESELRHVISKTINACLNEHYDTLSDIKDLPKHSKYPDVDDEIIDDEYYMGVL